MTTATEGATVPADPPVPTTVRPAPGPQTKPEVQRQPPYAVVLHNDHVNAFDDVVGALRKVFHYGREKAYQLTLAAHTTGRSIVWSGSLEVAELKVDQLRSCSSHANSEHPGAPLRVSIEPLPG